MLFRSLNIIISTYVYTMITEAEAIEFAKQVRNFMKLPDSFDGPVNKDYK